MHKHLLLTVLLFSTIAWQPKPFAMAQSGSAQFSPQVQQVIQYMRDRKRAYEKGDAAAWGAHVAENCSFVEAGGRLSVKSEFAAMEGFVGYTLADEISDVHASEFSDTIVLTYRQKETRDFGTLRSVGTYLDTETYTRVKDEWRLVLFTENLIPPEPAIVKLDPKLLDEYVGTYAVNAEATFAVTREGNKLFGQYPKEEKTELLPASESTFFTHGDSALYLFVWVNGHVVGHVYRAMEGVEVSYNKKR